MPTNQLVETLHKFTLSYGMTITTFHNDQIIVAENGEIVSMDIKTTNYTPITLFDGKLLVKIAALGVWNSEKESIKIASTALMI